ncbi:UGGT1 [Branchiostoma lanceolatum]|uniref:UDP-glucose ceramide glucosyltransferase-like 1 n=1 Tax=Branchiostoma lanceolatum TaxID=7740 RepID=A0A8K0EE50_BRALA|nr:UGGT1 [Branchiostoma lanceolatum]
MEASCARYRRPVTKLGYQNMLLFLVIVLSGVLHTAEAKSKSIVATLDAKWRDTPLLLEASEFLAQESNDAFWGFANKVAEVDPKQITSQSDHSYHHYIQKLTRGFLSEAQVKVLRFTLALRAHSPTVEMFAHLVEDLPSIPDCPAFVDVHNQMTCDPSRVKGMVDTASGRQRPHLYKVDHQYPGSSPDVPVAILYAELGTQAFKDFHSVLRDMADKGDINYVLRHYIKVRPDRKVRLSGYGVELAIKSTEYKNVDDSKVQGDGPGVEVEAEGEDEVEGFIFKKLRQIYPDLKEKLKSFRSYLIESTNEMAPLKVWQIQDLSFQAAQRIVSSAPQDALRVMRDVSQNFPTQARSLVRTQVQDEVRKEIQDNQKVFSETLDLGAGESALLINGLHVDLDIVDPFLLLDTIKNEVKLMEGLWSLGIREDDLKSLLYLPVDSEVDNYAIDIRDHAVHWINNLETDHQYKSWPSNLQELLRPMFPGMLRHIRKNMYHMVFFLDPLQKEAGELVKLADLFYRNQAPVRIGLVFVVNDEKDVEGQDDVGVALIRAYNFIQQDQGSDKAFLWLNSVCGLARNKDSLLDMDHIKEKFRRKYPGDDIADVIAADSDYDDKRRAGKQFYQRTGLGPLPQVLMNGVPFTEEEISPENFEESVVSKILGITPELQRAVYMGELTNSMNLLEWLMDRPNVMPRLNPRVLSTKKKTLDLTTQPGKAPLADSAAFSRLSSNQMAATLANGMKYLTKKDEVVTRAVTMWVVCDMEAAEGRQLLYDAIKHMKSSNTVRIGVLHNPTSVPQDGSQTFARAVQAALDTQTMTLAKNFITKLAKEENVPLVEGGKLADLYVNGMDTVKFEAALKDQKKQTGLLTSHWIFVKNTLKVRPGQRAIVANGMVVGPLDSSETFDPNDFGLLEKFVKSLAADNVAQKIKDMELNLKNDGLNDLVMKASGLLIANQRSDSRREVTYSSDKHSAVKIPGDPNEAAFDILAVVDPTTRDAQRLAPILMVLQQAVNANLKVFMNSREKLSEMPLKSFYRYVLEAEVGFMVNTSFSPGPSAKFVDMPDSTLFTLNMKPPESWLIESVRTPYDLDNIRLEDVVPGTTINAEYELEYLLLEGHCYDAMSGQPPRGLQFTLGTHNTPVMVDTIVMANLGYFQLKANPGAWLLRMRAGRSEEIYQITNHDGTDTPAGSDDVTVIMDSFKSKIIKIKVNKRPDKLQEDLLSDEGESGGGGIWDSISSFTGGGKKSGDDTDEEDVINIFSVASGHLYERLLRIMMLSVLKQTKTPVKFWFLKNYLSPAVKDFLPHMAKEYGFDYELVQYKWPRWLHQQTEKQRIIWGYKILFLDVLFPLSVKKIIFVDADQIVRTDIKELRDLDLGGAPYGYTPFCDSRREMNGFRFWKSGYWASHLGGRKYHISALYVVDLKKFRRIAAGDRLRGQYQGLSQDPNSLSNLDQDLPNNMIHQVAIKSLPQEWLWCETWCDDASKRTAKTIDLCNNPLTKEPKLEAAVRIVPEWTDYDNEIKTLQQRLTNGETSASTQPEEETLQSEGSQRHNHDHDGEL